METVLCFAPGMSSDELRERAAALLRALDARASLRGRVPHVVFESEVGRALGRLRDEAIDAMFVDTRHETEPAGMGRSGALLQAVFGEHEIAGPVSRARTWLLASTDGRGVGYAFLAGRLRLAGVLDASPSSEWDAVVERIESLVKATRDGKVALCLAGGGIEGSFYELGVLRAIQSFLPAYDIQKVDVICGISVGALLGAFLANGLSPDEVLDGLRNGTDKLEKLGRSDCFDPNVGEFASRIGQNLLDVSRGKRTAVQGVLGAVPAGAFAGKRLLAYLERQLARPGMKNTFAELPREFYVGATDQDTAEHVVFGDGAWRDVPIHLAVRASAALTPFYAPQRIHDRYFIDGGFSRTTNVQVAVERGATLVILVDPLVPVAAESPGYVARKGAVLGTMQALKSMIHGRFGRAAHQVQARFPHVAVHHFQPEGDALRIMGGSPMKFFYRTEIEEIAYRETIRIIRRERMKALRRDFASHGIAFVDPDEALGVVKRDVLDEADQVIVR